MEGPLTTVIIDDDALGDLSSEIARAMMRPSGGTSSSGTSGAAAAVTEWDAEGWHYDGSGYRGCESSRMERVALYVLSLDAINFCFWPDVEAGDGDVDGDGDGRCGAVAAKTTKTKTTTRNSLEYEHLAIALRKVAEADDENDDDENDDVENVVDVDVAVVRSGPSYALGPANLSTLTPSRLRSLLRPHFPSPTTGEEDVAAAVGGRYYDLPNVEVRCALLNELGRGLLDRHDGSALRMISKANGSADALVGIILDTFPGFRDYCVDASSIPASDGWEAARGGGGSASIVHFYKRAQIAVADLWAALGRRHRGSIESPDASSNDYLTRMCRFDDICLLTTFPDYRVPQILRRTGALRYDPRLAGMVDGRRTLERGGVDEISIRAGTVVAVEDIVRRVREEILKGVGVVPTKTTKTTTTAAAVADDGGDGGDAEGRSRDDDDDGYRHRLRAIADDVSAVTIDWYLWQRGERLDRANSLGEHHRVITTFY
jgi:hypothetical protein